jgi:hypothetical protein
LPAAPKGWPSTAPTSGGRTAAPSTRSGKPNQGLGLPRGIERGLLVKLGAAQRNVDAGNLEAACGSLGAYSNQVHAHSDHTLDGDQAAEPIAEATAIRELLGCSAG